MNVQALKIGEIAPDFELRNVDGEPVRLSDEIKKNAYTIIAFFPAAFSPVCTNEMNVFEEAREEFGHLSAGLLAISVGDRHALREFAERNGLQFPVLSDFHPHGKVASVFGVLGEDGLADRALFILDQDRRVRYGQVWDRQANPGADALLQALEEMEGLKEAA
jgi:peroxiredoxin